MTIDERLDRLTERHEALAQSLEMLTADVQQSTVNVNRLTAKVDRLVADGQRARGMMDDVMLSIARLATIAQSHDNRIERLEGSR